MRKEILRTVFAAAVLLGAWTAAAGNWSDADYQTAYRLLEAANVPQMLEEGRSMMLDAVLEGNSQLAQFRSVCEAFLKKYMSYEAVKKPFAEAYLEIFSQAELEEMIAFYNSATGRKFAANQSKLFQRGSEIGKAQVEAHALELQLAVMQEMQKQQKTQKPQESAGN